MWDQVYAGVREQEVELNGDDGSTVVLEVVSFRMIAEVQGRFFQASHVVHKHHMDQMPEQYGFILDEMVEFIDRQAGLIE